MNFHLDYSKKDFGNLYLVSVIKHPHCSSKNKRILKIDEYFSEDNFFLRFYFASFFDKTLGQKSFAIKVDKETYLEWVIQNINTNDLFNIDSWNNVKLFNNNGNSYISFKYEPLKNVLLYKNSSIEYQEETYYRDCY